MTNDQVKQEFLNNNIAGRYDLPANIYQNVDVIASGSLLNRQIKVQTSSRSIYYEGIAEFNLTVEKTNIDSYSWND